MTRAKRNNNPVNLRYAGQREATGSDKDGFAVFPDPQAGWRAGMAQIMLDARRGLTLRQYIHKFAPPCENDTDTYLSFVSHRSGVLPDVELRSLDLETLIRILKAQARIEGYYVG